MSLVTDRSPAGRIAPHQRLAGVSETAQSNGSRAAVLDRLGKVPRLLLTREESARAMGMSLRHFQRHVQPQLPCVYCGQLRLYRPADLERWIETESTPAGRAA
jgi:hypothetical protein